MLKIPPTLLILILLISAAAETSAGPATLTGRERFVPGEILVRWKDGASLEKGAKTLASLGAFQALNHPRFFKVKLKAGLEVLQAVDQIKNDPSVLFAQPNYRYYASCAAPTDLYYTSSAGNWPFLKIQAPQAWNLFSVCPPGSSSVTVAVIDSGVARTHPDLPPSALVSGYNALTNTTDASVPSASDDNFGHGTYVTALIAAQWNGVNVSEACTIGNTTGMAGLAPGVKILPVKVLDNTGSGTTDSIVAGTQFAVDNGARVLNYSLGSSPEGGIDPAEKQALDYALANNCVIVAAAGNEAGAVNFPAAYPPVIAVGATDPNDQVTCYSNTGVGLDLVAPGGKANNCSFCGGSCYDPANEIFSAVLECPTAASLEFNRMTGAGADFNFGTAAGTSASTPFVTGAAALVFSMNPSLTNNEVVRRLIDNSDSLNGGRGWDARTGYGRLNVYRALLNSSPDLTGYVKTFNSPNPFYVDVDLTTNLTLVMAQPQPVELTLYDTSGEIVFHKNYAASELNNNPSNPQFKSYYLGWDGRNGNGQTVKTGVYFYTVKTGSLIGRNKIAVIQGPK